MLHLNQRFRAHRHSGDRMSMMPWRTVILGSDSGRFTREELDEAVRFVMEQRQATYRASRPMVLREVGTRYGTPSAPPEPAGPPPEPVPYGRPRRGGARKRKDPASGG